MNGHSWCKCFGEPGLWVGHAQKLKQGDATWLGAVRCEI